MDAKYSKRGSNMSPSQKELLDFREEHPELKTGKFSANFTYKDASVLWMQLSNTLNATPGANRDWKLWRKVRTFLF